MIPFIPIIVFIIVQATLGIKYSKDNHGSISEQRRDNKVALPK
jgi:hypothetical protein